MLVFNRIQILFRKFSAWNQNGEKIYRRQIKRRIGIILGLCLFVGILIPVSAISVPGLIQKPSSATEDGFELENSSIYKEIKVIYEEYVETQNNQAAQLCQEYSDSITEESGLTSLKCSTNLERVPYELVFAYISTKYKEYQSKEDGFEVKHDEILQFLTESSSMSTSYEEVDGIGYYEVYSSVLSVQEIAEKYFVDSDVSLFLVSYESYCDLNLESEEYYSDESIKELLVNSNITGNGMNIPLYYQYDVRWAQVPYGGSTIQRAGCGPTCMAMVATYLNHRTIYPDEVGRWSDANGFVAPSGGSYWSLFASYSETVGIKCTELGKNKNSVIQALQNGNPVIASMGPGIFTKGGHFIVLRGITKDGKILVNDPNDSSRKNHYGTEFNFSQIQASVKNFWCFSK